MFFVYIILNFFVVCNCNSINSSKTTNKVLNKSLLNKIVVKVSGTPITEYDIDQESRFLILGMSMIIDEKNLKAIRSHAIDKLIDFAVINELQKNPKKSIKDSIEKTSKELFDNLASNNGISSKKFEKELNNHGIDKKSVIKHLNAQFLWHQYLKGFSDKKKHNNCKNNIRNQKMYEIFQIDLYKNQYDVLIKRAGGVDKLLIQIKDPKEFKRIALEFSKGKESQQAGYVGWKSQDQIEPKNSLKDLNIGSLTKPIKMPFGYRIMYLKDIKMPGKPPFGNIFLDLLIGLVPYELNSNNESPKTLEDQLLLKQINDEFKQVKTIKQFISFFNKFNLPLQEANEVSALDIANDNIKINEKINEGTIIGPTKIPQEGFVANRYIIIKKKKIVKDKEVSCEDKAEEANFTQLSKRELNRMRRMFKITY